MKSKKTVLILLVIFTSCISISFTDTSAKTEITSEKNQLEDVNGLVLMADAAMHKEYAYPVEFLTEYGCNIDVIAPKSSVTTSNGVVVEADFLISEMNNLSDYDFLFVPGGTSAGILVDDVPASLVLVAEAFESGLVMVAICAGPIVFVAADIVSGYNLSGNEAVGPDIENAGGKFIPDIICIDGPFVTADWPFMYTLAQQGILKALGLFESDPPVIVDYTIDTLATGDTESLSIVIEMADEYDIQYVDAKILLNTGKSTQSVYMDVRLYRNENIFTMILDQLPIGNYSISITVEDVLGNIANYELDDYIIIRSVRGLSIDNTAVLFCSSILVIIYFIKIRRKK